MIIKIVRDGSESVYQCQRYHMGQLPDDETIVHILCTESGGEETLLEVNKSLESVYIMNDNGKTIDVYRWK